MTNKLSFDRVVNFSDAVMAIVLTILVLELKIPVVDPHDLPHHLIEMKPEFAGFITSFIMVSILWLQHHKLFRLISDYNTGLLVLNLIFLLCVCFIPFPSGLVCKYPDSKISVILYYSTIGVASLSRFLMLIWCHRTDLLKLSRSNYAEVRMGSISIPIMCILSIITSLMFGNLMATVMFIFSPIFIKLVVARSRK